MKFFDNMSEATVRQVADILRQGGVAAVPTETVYGLVALWDNDAAREKIYQLKHRPHEKRLQMLADSVETAVASGLKPDPRLPPLAKAFWPGGLTVVAAAETTDSIGLRIPNHPFMLALLQELGCPLAATSANLAGQPAGLTVQEAISGLDGTPDAAVNGGYATVTGGTASTVVSLLGAAPVILREGHITLQQIQAALRRE